MREYNGFSSNERAKVGKLQLRSHSFRKVPQSQRRANYAALRKVNYSYTKDYSKPFEDAHPICRSCHLALHVRFTNLERWEKRKAYIHEIRGGGIGQDQLWIIDWYKSGKQIAFKSHFCIKTHHLNVFFENSNWGTFQKLTYFYTHRNCGRRVVWRITKTGGHTPGCYGPVTILSNRLQVPIRPG